MRTFIKKFKLRSQNSNKIFILKFLWIIVWKKFLNKLFIRGDLNSVVSKKSLTCVLPYLDDVLPYLDETSLNLRTRLRRTVERNLPYCRLKVIHISKGRFNTLLCFKDSHEQTKISYSMFSHCTCGHYNITYYGRAFRHLYARAAEHVGIFNLTGKPLKHVKQSAIFDLLFQCNLHDKVWWLWYFSCRF